EYFPLHEDASQEYPFQLISGRTVYHFHPRTKTARAPALNDAAPRVWAELSARDCAELGVAEGGIVALVSPRGMIRAAVRVTGIRPGTVFVPFHYGYWDSTGAAPQ